MGLGGLVKLGVKHKGIPGMQIDRRKPTGKDNLTLTDPLLSLASSASFRGGPRGQQWCEPLFSLFLSGLSSGCLPGSAQLWPLRLSPT